MARWLKEPFVLTFRAGLRELAMDRRCIGQDYRVLLYLLGSLEWDNRIRIAQKDVARELGVTRQAVWKALRRLVEYGIVEPGPKLGHLPTYRLSPKVGYFGPLARRRQERRQDTARQRLEALSEALHAGQALDVTKLAR